MLCPIHENRPSIQDLCNRFDELVLLVSIHPQKATPVDTDVMVFFEPDNIIGTDVQSRESSGESRWNFVLTVVPTCNYVGARRS